jgi:CRP/FNR family transcriptional regulator
MAMNKIDAPTAERSLLKFHAPSTPTGAVPVTEDLLAGGRALRRAFLESPIRYGARDAPLFRITDRAPPVILIRSGFAFRSCVLADGRRAILDVLVPGDVAGLDHIVLSTPISEITASNRVGYHALDPFAVRALLDDRCAALRVFALIAEARWRSDRLAAMIGRLDAQARIAALVLSIHDRLRRRGLTSQLSFNLPLTQEQIADHLGLTLVHVNRTLRRMREERLVLFERQAVMILDMDGLRQLVRGLPQPIEIPEPIMPPERMPLGD